MENLMVFSTNAAILVSCHTLCLLIVLNYSFILYRPTLALPLTPPPLPLFISVGRSHCRNSQQDNNGKGNGDSNMADMKQILELV